MKNSFSRIIAVCALVALTACKHEREETSDTLHEDAEIADVVYTPSTHSTEIGVTAVKAGSSFGFDYSGSPGLRVGGGLQVSSVENPEAFAVVFKCQHGQFIVTRKEVYDKLKDHKGAKVDVTYVERYRTTYDNNEGPEKVVARVLTGYHFLDATVK